MTTEERTQVRQKLEEHITQTEADIRDLKEATQPISPDNAIGRISRMDAINNKSVNDAALRASQVKLGKLQKNLERVEDKDFGLCTRCGKEIQMGRLLFMPESSWCIACARKG